MRGEAAEGRVSERTFSLRCSSFPLASRAAASGSSWAGGPAVAFACGEVTMMTMAVMVSEGQSCFALFPSLKSVVYGCAGRRMG